MTDNVLKNNGLSSVGIIGCGWLGSSLAYHFKARRVAVLATRSNAENTEQLNNQGIHAKVLSLPAEQALLNSHAIFKQQCLVVAITPQFRQGRVDYADKIQQLVESAKASNCVEKIILLSSSAVYNGLSGKVAEDSMLDMSADKVSLLNQAEQAVLGFNSHAQEASSLPDDLNNKKAYVLRLSGLVGPKRHPGKFLLNGRMLKSPQAIVNLIHQQDAVGLIDALLQSELCGGIFNGVSSTHITKKQYYQAAAKSLQLPRPIFDDNDISGGNAPKIVSGKKTQSALAYSFVYDDLLTWLEQAD
ncbi:SDR family oxidoreductase [Colwellia psychrerythraea]|uniref:NAD(P)-binding domain-containing protein n=1 Tax=Colwellia psychrerythraea TaxID=28229 RepID=A0A099KA45_COLPS|nr:SDR family oxidoreductase [Colwellia psychrerythraea]KGJ86957.1 hypothetical protein ND2E_0364 [Colwellia psychrerythraea]